MTAAELYRSLFEAMPPAAMLKFSALNPGLEGTIKAGSLIVLSDPDNNFVHLPGSPADAGCPAGQGRS